MHFVQFDDVLLSVNTFAIHRCSIVISQFRLDEVYILR